MKRFIVRILKKRNFYTRNETGIFYNKKLTTMTTPLIAPPARIWDKIEKILDEQDRRRKETEKLIDGAFLQAIIRRNKLYAAAFTCLSLLGGLVWSVVRFS